MFVCKECHTRDRKVTKCDLAFESHLVQVSGTCSVCGKRYTRLKWCYKYRKTGGSKNMELISLPNITKNSRVA